VNARNPMGAWPPLTGAHPSTAPAYREPDWPVIRVRCLLAFMHEGRRIEPGEEVNLILPLANDLRARGRVESLK
jgi:hypothetical protein